MKNKEALFAAAIFLAASLTLACSYAYTAGGGAAKHRGFQVLEEVNVRVVGGTLTLKRGTVIYCETEGKEDEPQKDKPKRVKRGERVK
jgi:hypothetical protein